LKIAYLVFAYRNPLLLRKLVETLICEKSAFFIHIDQKSNINDFASINGENIFFIEERLSVYWAEFSGVRAILQLIRRACGESQDYDYCVLLSGSEYPLCCRQYIYDFLEANRGKEFINIVKMPNKEAGKPISRINTFRIPSNRPFSRFIMKILARLGLAQRDYRKHLGSLEPYSGNTWWALTRDACQYILDFVEHNQNIVKYFENTFAPEEMFFHTIVGNSAFSSRIRRSLVYEDWSTRGDHPAMINEKHVAFFEANEKISLNDVYGFGELLFARKFSDGELEIVQKIDDLIKRKSKNFLQY
jgi:hypothetical protein